MNTASVDEERLQRYFDGDLSEAESEEVRRSLETSPEAQAELVQLAKLRSMIRMSAAEMADSLPSDDLYARIRSQIAPASRAPAAAPAPGLRVIEGGRRRTAALIGGGLAIAAAALLALLPSRERAGVEDGLATTATRTPVTTPQGTEVIEVDFGENAGTVFAVEGSAGQPLAVVWIDDDVQQVMQ